MRLCLSSFLIILQFATHAAEYTHLTVKDGLPSNTIYFAMQDTKGFMWFCTPTGVCRYDGRKFENFTINEGLADNEIFRCIEDSKGRVWFLSYNGKLSFFLNGEMHNSGNTPWLSCRNRGAFLLNALEDKEGNVWFTTSLGDVIEIAGDHLTKYNLGAVSRQYNNAYLSSVLFQENDSIKKFIRNDSDVVYTFNLISHKLRKLGTVDIISDKTANLKDYIPAKDENIFIADKKIISYRRAQLKLLTLNRFKAQYPPTYLLYDTAFWWLAIGDDGVYRLGSHSKKQDELHLLPHETVTCIVKDREGNMWCTSYNNGIFLYKTQSNVQSYLLSKSILSITPVFCHKKQYIVAGCGNGDVKIITPSGTKTLSCNKKPFDRVLGVVNIAPESIVIEKDNGIFNYNPLAGSISTLSNRPGNKSYFQKDSVLWLCGNDKIMCWKRGRLFFQNNPIPYSKLTSIAVLSDSVKYIGTTYRLYKLTSNQVHEILSDSILKTGINDLNIVDGNLWVATHGNGIFILCHDTLLQHIDSKDGLLAGNICQKIYADDRRIWVATNKGMTVFTRHTSEWLFNITTSNGLSSNDVKSIIVDSNKLYIATAEGINILNTQHLQDSTSPPQVYITGIRQGDKSILDPGAQYSYKYFKGFITVSFTAVTFQSPLAVQYEYKFEENADWHKTQSTDIPLFDLSPGTHTLLFRAKKYNSQWSKPIVFSILVNPLWYQRKRFFVLIILLVVGIISCALQLRIKSIKKNASEKTSLHKKIIELRGNSLAHQMNPHFIFNSLNTIQQFILVNELTEGLNYLSDFSLLMRNMLENSRKNQISLKEELVFLHRYLQLERMRFENKFNYEINVDKRISADEIKLPPALFQPLLENAIKHGMPANQQNGFISLKIAVNNDFIEGIVEDNGKGIQASVRTEWQWKAPTALKVLEERISLLKNNNGKGGKIEIIDKASENYPETGTIVKLLIPLNNGN
ncbi:MAG: histidine kinase [Bacteroidetes bacterium]|nr:histidine kinase [Bacteroidota bacterium]